MTVELLTARQSSPSAGPMLKAMRDAVKASGETLIETTSYRGGSEFLVLFGVGADVNARARDRHTAAGGKALLWDLGYFGRKKITGYLRCSVNHDHPQQWLDRTTPDPSRWDVFKIPLRDDSDPAGPIILAGMGRKSRAYLGSVDWERLKYRELVKRFPGRRIIYRPKSGLVHEPLPCEQQADWPIERLLHRASLVVCRHSNVAVDAVIAGVPFEADDGAAVWLQGKPYTSENRLDFLRRLAWWQYKSTEGREAWNFIRSVTASR